MILPVCVLPASVLEEVGALDPDAIAQVQAEAWPDVRDADELHDVLHTLVAMPESSSQFSVPGPQTNPPPIGDAEPTGLGLLAVRGSKLVATWQAFFERLLAERRAFVAEEAGRKYWVAAERADLFAAMHPGATAAGEPARGLLLHSERAGGETGFS